MEQQWDTMASSLKAVQELLVVNGMLKDNKRSTSGKSDSESVTTVYKNAVEKVDDSRPQPLPVQFAVDSEITFNVKNNRDSTSSEERMDTSDELMEIEGELDVNERFIADCAAEARRAQAARDGRPAPQAQYTGRRGPSTEEGENIIRQNEANKANLYATPGNYPINMPSQLREFHNAPGQCSAAQAAVTVDENYLVIGSHVDSAVQQKIIHNEYVDFAKLLPKGNRVAQEEDHRMELISKGGYTYFVPVSDREVSTINGFSRWEQAFRIFSNIYTRAYPHKATELIQYNHVIYTASTIYAWENVYKYDREFRLHLSKFPQCSWSVILQQAWSMFLKDKLGSNKSRQASPGGSGQDQARNPKMKSNENCRRYNKGLCKRGASCMFQHKCDECGKFGHGAHICHKRKANQRSGGGPGEAHNPK